MHRFTLTALGAAAAIALAGPALADHHMGGDHKAMDHKSMDATKDGRKLMGTLTGAAEVPGPGDADGTGTIEARVNPGTGQFCYTLTAAKIDPATMAHIHKGAAGVAGPVVITLMAPADGSSEGCVTIARDLALALVKMPGDYYANVHNAAYPGGAVRGQLGK